MISSHCSADFVSGEESVFSFFQSLWLVCRVNLMILMRISNLITKVQYIFLSLTNFFHSDFIKAHGFTGAINPTWDVRPENTRKACKSRAVSWWFTSFSSLRASSLIILNHRNLWCISYGYTRLSARGNPVGKCPGLGSVWVSGQV